MLQAQLIPEAMQDGKMDEPYTTYILQMEGTLLKKEFDRASGYKHMIRPHAEDALRLLVKASKGKAHVWFWGSDSQPLASTLAETLFLGSDVSVALGACRLRMIHGLGMRITASVKFGCCLICERPTCAGPTRSGNDGVPEPCTGLLRPRAPFQGL